MNDPMDNGSDISAPRRNNYFYSKLMGVLQFQMEQTYEIRHRWLLNRLTLGVGVLCGLDVRPRDTQVCITRGAAVNSLGQEIIVPKEWCLDPWMQTDERGCATTRLDPAQPHTVYVCLTYDECPTDFRPVTVNDCDTRDDSAAGTIVETFRVLVSTTPPHAIPDAAAAVCGALVGRAGGATLSREARRARLCHELDYGCETLSTHACVPIAKVDLLAGETIGPIDTCTYRPVLYSNAVLLDLILCLAERLDQCCGPTPVPTPTPTESVPRTPTPTPSPSTEPGRTPRPSRPVPPTPTPTPAPTVSLSPTPTSTPTPTPTPTPSPSASPTPPPSQTPPRTPRPSRTPPPSETPRPTPEPSPSATPRPTPPPSRTPQPTPPPSRGTPTVSVPGTSGIGIPGISGGVIIR